MKTLLEMTNVEAKDFFLKQKSYCSIDLPVYFDFQPLLNTITTKIGTAPISSFLNQDINPNKPKHFEDVNCLLLNNKDGKYAWRPLQIIHPALYVDLINTITKEENWLFLQSRFSEFNKIANIRCLSLSVESDTIKKTDKAVQIERWWVEIEQQSIELGLDYEFILHTDISNCYGSFYTHSIAWALHGKQHEKEKLKNHDKSKSLGDLIDTSIRNMTNGQTNGLPQGSILMDFIAEMILGYADLLLHKKLSTNQMSNYKILRYRDDYRIFSNNPQNTDLIVKALTEVLIELGLKLQPSKTLASNRIVRDSLKADKLYWINSKQFSKGLQKTLFIIHALAEAYPNSGMLKKALQDFFDRLVKIHDYNQNVTVLISIVVDIMLNSPGIYPVAASVISHLIRLEKDKTKKVEIIDRIKNRFKRVPNISYLDIWLQRISLKLHDGITFEEKLCKKVNDNCIVLWNSDWLCAELKNLIDTYPIVDPEHLNKISVVINRSEVELFQSTYMEF